MNTKRYKGTTNTGVSIFCVVIGALCVVAGVFFPWPVFAVGIALLIVGWALPADPKYVCGNCFEENCVENQTCSNCNGVFEHTFKKTNWQIGRLKHARESLPNSDPGTWLPTKRAIAFALICFAIAGACFYTKKHTAAVDHTPQFTKPTVAEIVHLKGDRIGIPTADGGKRYASVVLVAVDEASLAEMMGYVRDGALRQLFTVMEQNRGTFIPDKTRAEIARRKRIQGTESEIVQIRVLDGELRGYTVWTHAFFVP